MHADFHTNLWRIINIIEINFLIEREREREREKYNFIL